MQEFCHSHDLTIEEAEAAQRCSQRKLIRNFYTRIFNMIGAY